ncbi:hypothetical protein [Leptospira interrogans]|uniref:hypothetical protein n=1 Tax=Leptospira interrogans TaxID=173 RepID=UPI000A98905E|nr:hypothetical protein [Leptospira interrogans]
MKNFLKKLCIILLLKLNGFFCSASQEQQVAHNPPPIVISPPLLQLNTKETVSVDKCSCSVKKLPMESGAGEFGNAFLAHLTPESDREYELTCKGKITNKTKYKLQNVQLQWEYLSATKFPIKKGPVREYENNYIFPNKESNVSIVIGQDRGIKNFFIKEVKHYDCKLISAIEVNSGETLSE